MNVKMLIVRLVFVGLLLVAMPAPVNAQAAGQEELRNSGLLMRREATAADLTLIYRFARNAKLPEGEMGRDKAAEVDVSPEEFIKALLRTAASESFGTVFESTSSEPVVAFVTIGNSRSVSVLRRGYRGAWLDRNDRRLGRARAFWALFVADRPAEVDHSIVVRTRSVREYTRQSEFDSRSFQASEKPDVEGDRSVVIGVKRFRVPYTSTQAVTFKSTEVVSGQTHTDEFLFRTFDTNNFGVDFAFLAPLNGRGDERYPYVNVVISPLGIRDHAESGEYAPADSLTRFAGNLFPNFVCGVGIAASSESWGERFFAGIEWPLRGTPLGVNLGMAFRQLETPGLSGTERRWKRSWTFGLSLAVGRTVDIISGR